MKFDLSTYTKYQIIIFPVLVAAVSFVLIFFVIYPQITKYFKGQEDAERLKDRVERLTSKSQALESLDVSGLNADLEVALKALPSDRDLANLVGVVQQVASQNSVALLALSIGQTSGEQGKYNPFDIRLEIGGSSTAIKNFLTSLEKSSRVMKVSSIDLTLSRASDSASAISTTQVYFAPTPNEIGAIDAPLSTISEEEKQVIDTLSQVTTTQPDSGQLITGPKGKPNPFQ